MADVLIVGGGVIGLSLAYELAGAGLTVQVVERGQPGREASWAGAGILPPAQITPTADPYEQLLRLSNELHVSWSAQLREQTGIDNCLRHCGGVYIARDTDGGAELRRVAQRWREQGISCQELSAAELAEREPALDGGAASASLRAAYFLPGEMQLRNPRHLKALLAGCARRGVEVLTGVSVEEFETRHERIDRVLTSGGALSAGQVCLTSGAWTKSLLSRLGVPLGIKPIRGQIVLLNSPRPLLHSIVNEGPRYLVPRADGRLLIGSTEEDVGFEKLSTAAGVSGLLQFALELAPGLKGAQLEQSWAGLRPSAVDRMPYLGRLPRWENAYVAAGHFRSGLQLSPGTALVVGRLMRGLEPGVDLGPFRLDRA